MAFLLAPSVAWAGAWTLEQGSFLVQLGYSYARATSSYLESGLRYDWQAPFEMRGVPLPGAHRVEQMMSFYGEVGLFDPLTLSVAWEAKVVEKDLGPSAAEPVRFGSASGIGEVRLGLRGRFLARPFVGALEGVVGIPAQQRRVDPVAYDPQNNTFLGIGTTHVTTWLHLAKNWSDLFSGPIVRWWELYSNVAVGVQLRTNFMNVFVYNAEVGNWIRNRALVLVRVFGDYTVGEIPERFNFGAALYKLNVHVDQQQVSAQVGWRFAPWLLATVDYTTSLAGRLTVAYDKVTFALTFKN